MHTSIHKSSQRILQMDTHRNPLIILVFLVSLHFSSSTSYAVPPDIIGRHKGSVLSPFGGNIHWDEHFKFHINNSILLKSDEKGSSLVLEVSKEDYENCNTKNPIKKMEDGNSMFQFGQSGTFYIISGNQESCKKGKKYTIFVPPITNNPYHPTPSPSRVPPKKFTPISPPYHAPMSFSHAPKASPPKRSISYSANTLSSSHAPLKAPTPVAYQPPSHTARTPISPSIASKLPSSLSPTSPHAPSSNISPPVMSPQGSRTIPSSSPTSLPAPSSNNPPVTSPQGSSNIIAPISSNKADISSGSPPKSSSATVMAITPTALLASVLSLSIGVALQELFTIYH